MVHMDDYIGLGKLVDQCLELEGVKLEGDAGPTQPPIYGDEHLVMVLSQVVRGAAFDVTDPAQYSESYQDYARLATEYKVLRVPSDKLAEVSQIFDSHQKVRTEIPLTNKLVY